MKLRTFWISWGTFNLIFLLLVAGCAHSLTLNSVPREADVFMVLENGTRGGLLGKTPLLLSGNNQNSFELVKLGYSSTYVFLPENSSSRDVNLRVELPQISESWLEQVMLGGRNLAFESSATDLLNLQALLFSRKEKEFFALAKKIDSKFGKLALFHVLVGNFYFAKKDYKNAQESYRKALEIDPGSKEAAAMLKLLRF